MKPADRCEYANKTAQTTMESQENCWMIACRSRELGRKRTLALTLEGQSLVLYRCVSGAVAALEDRCAHRNAPLSRGAVCETGLRCRYHGWVWGPDGRLLTVPALAAENVECSSIRVKNFHACEQDGFVWVSTRATLAASSPLAFPHLGEPGWSSFIMKNRFDAPIEACLENFLDCPHATSLHRYWFRTPVARRVRVQVRCLADGAEAEYFGEPREKSLVWWLLAPRRGDMRHVDRFIAPRTSRVDYEFPGGLHYIITSSCSAIDERATQVYTVISFRHPWLGPLIQVVFEPLARFIIRQDIDMLTEQYANIARFGGPRFNSTGADLLGKYIIAWRNALAAGAVPPAAGETHEVELYL
jgi:phenylpropionate dioxygenase-like ring-hydroxylating dioxygenase large terminal subunit